MILSLAPVAHLLAYSLECRYAPVSQDALETLDIVVVLGGGTLPSGGLRPEAELSGLSYSRACWGVRTFHRSSANLLAFCGGCLWPGAPSEAALMKALALEMGVCPERIVTETESRNTEENLARLATVLPAGRERCFGLVTSATHMLRSEQVFRKHFPEDTVIPVPVSHVCGPLRFRTKTFIPTATNLANSTAALHEWLGLAWYHIRYR